MIDPDELFVRRFDDLCRGLSARDDYERVQTAAVLRQLLLDERPLLHEANRTRQIPIRFRVNTTGPLAELPVALHLPIHARFLDPTEVRSMLGVRELRLDRFLALPMAEIPGCVIRVRDIIQFAANKDGGVHYDSRRAPHEADLEGLFLQLSALGVPALAVTMAAIAKITIAALQPLRDAIVILPPTLRGFAHYRLTSGAIAFNGRDQCLMATLDHQFGAGWGWHGVARIGPQAEQGDRVIYEIGAHEQITPRLSLMISDTGGLCARAQLDASAPVEAVARDFRHSVGFDRFSYLAFDLVWEATEAAIRLFINNDLVAHSRCTLPEHAPRRVTRQALGADLAGRRAATFALQELVLVDASLTDADRASLAKYFWLQWHG